MSLNKRLFIPQDTGVDPTEHFNTVLYTGNAGTKEVTSVGFQPDLVWIKTRNQATRHLITDSVRGVDSQIFSNETLAEQDYGEFDSFDSTGFTVSRNTGTDYFNQSTINYVSWCFKAGGAASGSDKVSIDGTSYADEAAAGLTAGSAAVNKLSVNTKLGFSIATGSVAANGYTNTYCHGLDVKPDMIITKVTSGSSNWVTILPNMSNDLLKLNTTDSTSTDSFFEGTSTTLKTGYTTAAYDFVAYCFASKEGVSKVGSYTGTGTTANEINTGFQPTFLLVKCTSSSLSYHDWYIFDNKRGDNYLTANENIAEVSSPTYNPTFNSTGFKWETGDNSGGWNASGETYIYLAIA